MRRRVAALVVLGITFLVPGSVLPARAAGPPTTAAVPPMPPAYVVVDADTGNVLAAADAHTPRLPASTIKLMTALIAVQRLKPTDPIPVSALAESMPARKMNLKAGQTWTFRDLLYSLMLVSANDAAVAIAEKLGGGSLAGWKKLAQETGDRLGLVDHPVFNDPAGLDDEFSQGGGTLISPRDLAIIARAVTRRPDLMTIVATRSYEFAGGDGLPHKVLGHDIFLDLYPGATGLKTGATKRAGRTFVASATREGRTMIAVLFDAVDPVLSAEAFLDQAFATPVAAEPTTDRLPAVVADAAVPTTAPPATEAALGAQPAVAKGSNGFDLDSPPVAIGLLVAGTAGALLTRRRLTAAGPRRET